MLFIRGLSVFLAGDMSYMAAFHGLSWPRVRYRGNELIHVKIITPPRIAEKLEHRKFAETGSEYCVMWLSAAPCASRTSFAGVWYRRTGFLGLCPSNRAGGRCRVGTILFVSKLLTVVQPWERRRATICFQRQADSFGFGILHHDFWEFHKIWHSCFSWQCEKSVA